jgi:hypothetical protein
MFIMVWMQINYKQIIEASIGSQNQMIEQISSILCDYKSVLIEQISSILCDYKSVLIEQTWWINTCFTDQLRITIIFLLWRFNLWKSNSCQVAMLYHLFIVVQHVGLQHAVSIYSQIFLYGKK